MTMLNAQDSDLDPSKLKPVDAPSTVQLGVGSGDGEQARTLVQTPMEGPDGRRYIQQQVMQGGQPVGAPGFISKAEDGSTIQYSPGRDGYVQGTFEKRSLGEAVFEDKKLMTFLAIATAGSMAGMAGGGEVAALGGTGSTPGTVGASASGLGGTSAVAPVATSTATNVAGSTAYSDLAGLEGLNQINLTTAGSTGVATGSTTLGTSSLANSSSWFSDVMGFAKANPQITAGIISGIGTGIAAHERAETDERMLDKKLNHDAAEAEKQRQHDSRNFQPGMVPKINWGGISPIAGPSQVKMKNSFVASQPETTTLASQQTKSTTLTPQQATAKFTRKPIIAGAQRRG